MLHLTIVDDDEDDVDFLTEALSALEKIEITRLKDGIELLTLAKEKEDVIKKTNAIILDIMLPLKDGIETLEELKQTYDITKIPVIMLTSSSLFENRCIKAGCSRFFTKPNTLEEYKFLAQEIFDALKTA